MFHSSGSFRIPAEAIEQGGVQAIPDIIGQGDGF